MSASQESGIGRLVSPHEISSILVGEIILAAKEHLDADISFLAEFVESDKRIRAVAGEHPQIRQGAEFPLLGTFCYRVAHGHLPNVVSDARDDARVKDLAITRELNIGSYIGVPVALANGRIFGTLCCVNREPGSTWQDREVKFMRVLADLVGRQLLREEERVASRRQSAERIRAVMQNGLIRAVYQPIVDLASGAVVGVEALARFGAEPNRSPDKWFAEAWDVDLGVELELAAARVALAQFPGLPTGQYMSLNLSPRTIESGACRDMLAALPAERIVVEITEHVAVDDYAVLDDAVALIKQFGIRLAVDDVGVGFSGLKHILQIKPSMIKLDLSLTRGVHTDPAKQAMASASVAFGLRTGAAVVAEGIETKEDAETLRVIGIRYGQGYYLGKPGLLERCGDAASRSAP